MSKNVDLKNFQAEAYAVGEVVCTGKTLPSSKDSAPLH
jgi:hypothetical protein